MHTGVQVCLARCKHAAFLGRSHLGSRSSCVRDRSLEGGPDVRLGVEMLQHSFVLPGWSRLPATANPHLSLLVCVGTHLITITASQSKFLGFIIFLLVLQGIQQVL